MKTRYVSSSKTLGEIQSDTSFFGFWYSVSSDLKISSTMPWVLLPSERFPLNLSMLASSTARAVSSTRLFLGMWRVLYLLFYLLKNSLIWCFWFFFVMEQWTHIPCLHLTNHDFMCSHNRSPQTSLFHTEAFPFHSLSHYISWYIILVTIISLLHTFLAVPYRFWESNNRGSKSHTDI